MKTLTSKQRAHLRSIAQNIDASFQIGKNGVTPELTEAISEALDAREILKVSVLNNCMLDPKDICETLSERTKSIPVQVIGKKIVLFKPAKKNSKISLPQ
ncbi:MAG: RNA-binding protein [Epulopiscium sp. Nele67-Bin004]|nr:MAG: RNA-binding protein [Epulopiscium sp. Nele67-Bin004]